MAAGELYVNATYAQHLHWSQFVEQANQYK